MIIAIDGPAGAGKSTTAREVARELGFAYIDTGAMYRAVALSAHENHFDMSCDGERIAELARSLPIRLENEGASTCIGARDVSELIRSPHIGALTSQVAALEAVHTIMVEQQRRLGREGETRCGGAVLEGRDIQTVVFPDAGVKIFLSANAKTRAERRVAQWQESGQMADVEETERELIERDARDSGREIAPLHAAHDAIEVATDELTPAQVVAEIVRIARARMGDL